MEKDFLKAYDKYAAGILRHAYLRIGNREMAEDLTQETFLKTWDSVVNNGTEIKNFKTFLFRVANNLIVDYYRKKSKVSVSIENIKPEEVSTDPAQEKEAEKTIRKKLLRKNLLALDDHYRQIIIYRYVNDFSIKEISKITGKSIGNINVIIHRGIKILKEKMKYENI